MKSINETKWNGFYFEIETKNRNGIKKIRKDMERNEKITFFIQTVKASRHLSHCHLLALCADSIFACSGVRIIFARSSGAPASPAFQVSYMIKIKKIGGVKLNYSGSDVTLIKT
jgi:hypothetical protein